jgi:CPA2 family monovalent cation:H+ antiporter-2
MHIDPIMPWLAGIAFAILLIGLISQMFRQPQVVGYLLAGIVLGPHVLGVITDKALLEHLGAIGVVLLLFFVGMEISPSRLVANWKVAVLGTGMQILISLGCIWLLGIWLDWALNRIVLLGFVISLSSTGVVLKLLQDWRELDTEVGQDVLGVLLVQDLAVAPMLLILGFLGGTPPSIGLITLQILGGVLIASLMVWVLSQGELTLPFSRLLQHDHEIQVFAALVICFGVALLTGLLGLSTALGAFVAGILVTAARETQRLHYSLEPFRVVFVALFFVSVGMLVDLRFLRTHWLPISFLVLTVLLTNTLINAVILRLLGDAWRHCLYAGAMLAQIGEFSFVLAAVGAQAGIITDFSYQATLAVIALTLLLSPAWITGAKRLLHLPQHGMLQANPARTPDLEPHADEPSS